MKRECVFKCWAQSEWWYVYRVDCRPLGVCYRVYKGRKWFGHVTFETMSYSICATMNAVTVGMGEYEFEVREKV